MRRLPTKISQLLSLGLVATVARHLLHEFHWLSLISLQQLRSLVRPRVLSLRRPRPAPPFRVQGRAPLAEVSPSSIKGRPLQPHSKIKALLPEATELLWSTGMLRRSSAQGQASVTGEILKDSWTIRKAQFHVRLLKKPSDKMGLKAPRKSVP